MSIYFGPHKLNRCHLFDRTPYSSQFEYYPNISSTMKAESRGAFCKVIRFDKCLDLDDFATTLIWRSVENVITLKLQKGYIYMAHSRPGDMFGCSDLMVVTCLVKPDKSFTWQIFRQSQSCLRMRRKRTYSVKIEFGIKILRHQEPNSLLSSE